MEGVCWVYVYGARIHTHAQCLQANVTEQQTPHTEHRTHPTTAQCLNRIEYMPFSHSSLFTISFLIFVSVL